MEKKGEDGGEGSPAPAAGKKLTLTRSWRSLTAVVKTNKATKGKSKGSTADKVINVSHPTNYRNVSVDGIL